MTYHTFIALQISLLLLVLPIKHTENTIHDCSSQSFYAFACIVYNKIGTCYNREHIRNISKTFLLLTLHLLYKIEVSICIVKITVLLNA